MKKKLKNIRFGMTSTDRGLSMLEVLIGLTIMALAMLSLARGFFTMNGETVKMKEKAFAAQKAIQMMEELRGLISDASNSNVGVLDDYDDGASFSYLLTTKKEVSDPADPVSGNPGRKFKRQINVIRLPNEALARRVYVRVYRASDGQSLAETISVLRTINNQYNPTQVFDVYVLWLENVPGWWVSLSTMKPMFDNVIQDLQTRNPGLEWRTHWITKLAYGRDPYYTPYINETVQTNVASPPSVYFYPGLMERPGTGNFEYYVASQISGRINVDGTPANTSSYSIADQYNHAVRYPEELALYNTDVAAATAAGQPSPEPSWRMLLEKMNTSSSSFENMMLINLHGELLPLPPMRNYSDPAKDPLAYPNVRVVTHPEQLQYNSGSQMNFRVYSYVMDPASWAHAATLPTITVLLKGVNLTSSQMTVRQLVGHSTATYAWGNAIHGTHWTVGSSGSDTLITLFNSPLRHAPNGNYGLPTADQLYGLEYIPCLVSAGATFAEGSSDLTWSNNAQPKNTARWVLRIHAGAVPNGQYTLETRIGDDLTTGTPGNKPTNVSTTYVWLGATPPVTELYQYVGDPRHMPYSDVKASYGYNWYFRSIDTSDYNNFLYTANGWNGAVNVNIPRYFQLLRTGLMNTSAIMSSMTGFSFYYIGLGGEMGYDGSNGFPSGLPIVQTPWSSSSSSSVGVDEITDQQTQPYARLISNTANTWWGIFWLGELYPDSEYANWVTNGNLPVGTGNYYRARYSAKGFPFDVQKRTNDKGCASFFNGNTSGSGNSYFQHDYWDSAVGLITTVGLQLSQDFNFPLLASLTTARPFRLGNTSSSFQPPEWTNSIFSALRTITSTLETYYDTQANTSTHDSSALVRIRYGSSAANAVMNGVSPQNAFGAAQIGKLCAVNMVRGFMSAGAPGVTLDRIPQIPLVTISSPTATDQFSDPSTIPVRWTTQWVRWDGQRYTEAYPSAGYSESTTLTTNIKLSADNGKTWAFVQDGATAEVGVLNASKALTTPYTWNVSSLARGNYVLRVETYRNGLALHYTYHQVQVYIQR